MRLDQGILAVVLLCVLSACRHTPDGSATPASPGGSAAILPPGELAEELRENDPGRTVPGHSIAELNATIDRLERSRRENLKYEAARYASEQAALAEVNERMILPDKYGRTVVISDDRQPLILPPGPMEELVNRNVSMHLQDAGVGELIAALSLIDGLNVIADQALQGEQRLTINVKDVPLKDILSYVARNMGIDFHISPNVIWVTAGSMRGGGGGPKLETRIFHLRKGFVPAAQAGSGDSGGGSTRSVGGSLPGFGGGGSGGGVGGQEDLDLIEALTEMLGYDSPEGSVLKLYKNRNLLLVRNSAENLRVAEELIASFDVVPRQVLIEARFLTISQNDLNQLGIDIENLSVSRNSSDNAIQSVVANAIFPEFAEGANSPQLAVSGILGNHQYTAVLRALYKLTDAETLSAPRLTVMNNQTARIRRGSNFYYWEEWEVISDTILTNDGASSDQPNRTAIQPVGRPTEIEQGITLDVTVNVGNDGKTVMLSLFPMIKNVDRLNFFSTGEFKSIDKKDSDSNTGTNNGTSSDTVGFFLPEVSESSVNTAVAVESGETVVLGGILENRTQQEVHKVPFLGDLPLVGALFRRTLVSREPRHLLIFVTARVVNPTGEYVRMVTE